MPSTRIQTRAVERFSCLGADCPNTCCKSWEMQVDPGTLARINQAAPALRESLNTGSTSVTMRRGPASDHCVKFTQGLCGIHRDYGEAMLGDACYFYPRIQRALGESVLTAMSVSCPEAARIMLEDAQAFDYAPHTPKRSSYYLHNYLPYGMPAETALAIHQRMIAMALDPNVRAERSFMRISAIARGLMHQPFANWAEALTLYITLADARISTPQHHAADLFNLVHALEGLVRATHRPHAELKEHIQHLAGQLGVAFLDNGAIALAEDASSRAAALMKQVEATEEYLQPLLRRYLAAELSQALFPFAGFGKTLEDRVTILGVRFAMVKYMLAVHRENSQHTPAEIISLLARFLDHLEDPAFTITVCREVGWHLEGRLRALVGDCA